MSLLDTLVAAALPLTPRFVVGRVARRYIAGETLDDAVATVVRLNARGIAATVDVLGEFIEELSEARATAAQYARVLDAIRDRGLRCNVSVKLTAFGLLLDETACLGLVRDLARRAAAQSGFVRIDMEDTSCTDATLRVVRTLRGEGLPVGAVLQAYLRRTERDAADLAREGVPVRLCKGIYREPESLAFHDREEIRASYRRCLGVLLDGPARVAIATHDETLVAFGEAEVARRALSHERYEFQMLLGVREWLRDETVAKGHPMRVYVPFGAAWYGYSVRRLRENPALAGHVFKAFLGRR